MYSSIHRTEHENLGALMSSGRCNAYPCGRDSGPVSSSIVDRSSKTLCMIAVRTTIGTLAIWWIRPTERVGLSCGAIGFEDKFEQVGRHGCSLCLPFSTNIDKSAALLQ